MTRFTLLTVSLLFGISHLHAQDTWYVDSRVNSGNHSGSKEAPFSKIAQAVAKAQPGDTIQLVPGQGTIFDSLVIIKKDGTPEQPIIFDGGGNTLTGSKPLHPQEWEEVRPGLYRSGKYLASSFREESKVAPTLGRCFFLFDGKMQAMGKYDKRTRPELPPYSDLKAGEWTFDQADKAFYLAVSPGKTLPDAEVEAPYLKDGVKFLDANYWTVRNLHVRHFLNDGFNFHGECKGIVLEKISATECGDDGMSAHDNCQIEVNDFTATGNASGICHIDASSSVSSLLNLRDNLGPNLFLIGSGTHRIENSRISTLGGGLRFGVKRRPEKVNVALIDCQIEHLGESGSKVDVNSTAVLTLSGTTPQF